MQDVRQSVPDREDPSLRYRFGLALAPAVPYLADEQRLGFAAW